MLTTPLRARARYSHFPPVPCIPLIVSGSSLYMKGSVPRCRLSSHSSRARDRVLHSSEKIFLCMCRSLPKGLIFFTGVSYYCTIYTSIMSAPADTNPTTTAPADDAAAKAAAAFDVVLSEFRHLAGPLRPLLILRLTL